MKAKVMIALFPYGHILDDRLSGWISGSLMASLMADKERIGENRIETYAIWSEADTPITMTRNKCLLDAERNDFDFVLMLDSDNIPDWHKRSEGAKPFWESTFDFMWKHRTEGYCDPDLNGQLAVGPCVVFAPYSGPPPLECTYSFDWVNHSTGNAFQDFALEMVPRHEAATRKGIRRAAAGPTGCMLIDMLAVKKMPHPRFYYEWKDETQSQKASTEDVTFTRDLGYMGVPVYCNWDAWAGHVKQKITGKPENIPHNWVPQLLRDAQEIGDRMGLQTEPLDIGRGAPVRAKNTYEKLPKGFPLSLVRRIETPEITAADDPVDFSAEDREFEKVGVNGEA